MSVSEDDIVKLNVGGTEFKTTRATLCYVKDSTLAAMFSGRWQNDHLTASGKKIFLDYNPILFAEIIKYFQQCIYQNQIKTSDREDVPSPTFESLKEREEFETLCDYLGIQQVIFSSPSIKDDNVNVVKFQEEHKEFDISDDPNKPITSGSNKGNTQLIVAAKEGNSVVVTYLLQRNAIVDAVNQHNQSALLLASCNGHLKCLKALIASSADVNKCNVHRCTPTYVAAEKGRVECLKELIASSADVNKCNADGWTPTHATALFWGHLECLKILIASSGDVNKSNVYGWTPTHVAALYGHADCIQVLSEAKANVLTSSNHGETPLDIAKRGSQDSCVQMLTKLMNNNNK